MILLLTGLSSCSKEETFPGDKVYWLGTAYFLTTAELNYITNISARTGGYLINKLGLSIECTKLGVCWSTSQNPTTADNKTEQYGKNNPEHFHSSIAGLNPGTTYFVRAYMTNSAGTIYGNELSFATPEFWELDVFNPNLTYGSVEDIDGNIYKTIKIGTQIWMAENLKTTRYSDGSQISNVTGDDNWVALQTGAYRWYENDTVTFKNIYGALYNWHTVNTGKLCPTGWHVPNDQEWKQLEMTLGMTQTEADNFGEFPGIDARGTDQGNKMKSTRGWNSWGGINGNGTNTSGFSALPGGEVGWSGVYGGAINCYFGCVGDCTSWWTSEVEGAARCVASYCSGVIRGVYPGICGFSVRCLKDN